MHTFGRSTRNLKPGKKTPAVEAMRLLGKWQRLAAGHIVLGGGCSCGSPVTSVRMQDFEQDILAFLHGRHLHGERAASIAELLTSIARQKASIRLETQLAMLADLERSIDSFDELHRGRG